MDIGNNEKCTRQGPCLDTVKALHQTVVSLRAALEQSRSEILELKTKAWPIDSVEAAIRALSIENHILRRKIVEQSSKQQTGEHKKKTDDNNDGDDDDGDGQSCKDTSTSAAAERNRKELKIEKKVAVNIPDHNSTVDAENVNQHTPPKATEENVHQQLLHQLETEEYSNNIENEMEHPKDSDDQQQHQDKTPQESEGEEVDDIELIFTTDETKMTELKEELVSIDPPSDDTPVLLHYRTKGFDRDLSGDASDRELDDDVFHEETTQMCNSKSDNSINQELKSIKSSFSYQDSSFENKSIEKDESFDRFEDRLRGVETDISKCGIVDPENVYISGRRNTCPNPILYRPIAHREAMMGGKGMGMGMGFGGLGSRRAARPILGQSNAARRDSGAQTDISALPNNSWRSESSLAYKVKGDQFTTLPSKFPLPGSKLRLSEKTVEARRVLLSDIGFTSMVPELSRSADHLCQGALKSSAVNNTGYGQFLKTTDLYSPANTSQRFTWSPSDGSQSRYSSYYPITSPVIPPRRCSAPGSPIHRKSSLKVTTSKVRFANGSLPELRAEYAAGDSGDSTDSLVEEAEHYLRRSIDCIVSGREMLPYSAPKSSRILAPRRASAPEPVRDNVPPTDWQPFLPRTPRDLRPDNWVKVITPEGRVRGGRVRYVGPIVTQTEPHVGVQLGTPDGNTDGTYNSRRYFHCEPEHGLFVPFKKVVMGWRP